METQETAHVVGEPPLLVTVQQAADLLGVGRNRIYALMATHEIEWLKLGVSRRITRASLYAYIERQCTAQMQQGAQHRR